MNELIHKTTVGFLALIVLMRVMAMPLSLLDYSLNKNFISSTLCENRFKTEMHCSGRCYLNKQLARTNDNHESSNQKENVKSIFNDFFQPISQQKFGFISTFTLSLHQSPVERISSLFTGKIFWPPIA